MLSPRMLSKVSTLEGCSESMISSVVCFVEKVSHLVLAPQDILALCLFACFSMGGSI